ncbi:hypothetical protein GC101_20130 [Paenibacillus sp. LMG 31459]|uniref:Uncharacterized protein n=1 Tax=Paenibacillus phytohabitans TaxID=2654978 RepID=A0ABX1YJG6_9BACL|nr:hypothetical protein [Paenibacillus phytohabitans]NOU81175.1 hypothetical protein [Paenibacillus phytohabitans]
MNQEVESSRKTRTDKKRAVSPFISKDHFELIRKLAYITDLPQKSVGEILITEGMKSNKIISSLRVLFRREFAKDADHLYLGDLARKPYRCKLGTDKKRLPMRFLEKDFNNLASLAYALDCSISMAAGLLIKMGMKRDDLYTLLSQSLLKRMNHEEIQDIRKLCRILDKNSPEHYITMPLLISHALELGISKGKSIKFIILSWKEKVR